MNKDIIFLLRSYNRPEYLNQTLEYLEYSVILIKGEITVPRK